MLYVHAVSGKWCWPSNFLRAWLRERGGSAVLATSTAGHDTAVNAQVSGVRVICAPLTCCLLGRCA